MATYSEPSGPGLQNKRNFEEDEKTSKRIQCPFSIKDLVASITLCVCGAKQNTLVERTGKSKLQTSLQESVACMPALTKLERRHQNLRGNIHEQSRAQLQCGKATDHWQKTIIKKKKSANIGNTKRDKEVQLSGGKMGLGPNRSRTSPSRKTHTKRFEPGMIWRSLRPKPIRDDNAQRRKETSFG